VSAGYLSNSWVVYTLQHIRYEASLHKEVKDLIVTDAGFKPAKQVADIEDLINRLKEKVSILIVTHNMQQAARVSDYTAFMYLGELIEFGDTNVVFTNPKNKQTEDYITGRFG